MAGITDEGLKKTLGPLTLWGLGVGYVISGMYFGWNLGLVEGGSLGLFIATLFIALMAVSFTFSYTELACRIPKAGGAFAYAQKAFGPDLAFVAGLAQIIEFVFAPPAIAAAIGAYFSLFFKSIDPLFISIIAYVIFTGLNIYGVKAAARFEFIITILAVGEILFFFGITIPHFSLDHFVADAFPNGLSGMFRAIPFALWFFVAIEGVANVAEETINPQRNILIGFGSAIITLLVLSQLTFISAVGVSGWKAVVYPTGSALPSDSPLPLALAHIVDPNHLFFHLLVTIGLFGLIASFHGILLASGRATFEMGRAGFMPRFLGKIHPRFHTPAWALVANTLVGILALCTGKTGYLITIACFGALSLYIISMLSLFRLRKKSDQGAAFKVPLYPYTPLCALLIASFSLLVMMFYNPALALIYFSIIFISWMLFRKYSAKTKDTDASWVKSFS